MWSHYADHVAVRAMFRDIEKTLESENPDIDLEMTFYEKNALFAAQMTALRAGKGPDVLYLEPDRVQFVESGFVRPIDDLVDLDRLHDFAKETWTFDGKVYALGIQAFTVELYYNKDTMAKVLDAAGMKMPSDFQFDQSEFLKLVKASAELGITPTVQGIGDRPYPGAYLTHELLLRKLGRDDYGRLWAGELSFKDPRIVETFAFVKQLIDAGTYPKTFATLKLGESHYYFHTKPGGLMFPIASWYTNRAFSPPDKGGQPVDFPLGLMQYPAMEGGACPECKSIAVAGSYALNAKGEHPELAAKFLNILAREEWGRRWIQSVRGQTGVKVSSGKFEGEFADYFRILTERNDGRKFFLGTPIDHIRGTCKETFIQVINAAFPAGLLGPNEALDMMEAACYKG